MAFTYFELYADETQIDGGGPFFFGALLASPRRIEIIRAGLKDFRAATGCSAEMKWTKVSKAYLSRYKQFVDVALKDRFIRFAVREIVRNASWYQWDRPNDERFWIAYYAFLRARMSAYSRYSIVLDYKNGKRHRWDRLRFAMNAVAKQRFELKKTQVRSLTPAASHDDDILQLVDVLLGALTSTATSPHKQELAAYVRTNLGAQFDEPWTVDLTKVKPRRTARQSSARKRKARPRGANGASGQLQLRFGARAG